ncbi:hypothetical protein QFZ27_001912 [Inquilinus ginsengisoli]|uniref:hypothetical protein n=1 Tax=Inquilinus ginsengisoli TaxID=363840 RepID=UPI003D1FC711
MSRRVGVTIDRLVLDGVSPRDRVAFERALRAEFARALTGATRSGELKDVASTSRLDAGTTASPGDGGAVGRQIAGRLTGGRR